MDNKEFYDFLIKVQSIAKMGLVYSKDPYAIDNYNEINNLTKEMLENFQNVKFDRNNYFEKHLYPTPNISVRTIVFNEKNQVLMVQEAVDGGYSFPGGWADLYESPSFSAEKEIYQEAGIKVSDMKLIGLLHQVPFKSHVTCPAYVAVFKAKFKSDDHKHCYETKNVGFFDIDKLPPLSNKTCKEETERILKIALGDKVVFD